MRRRSGRRNDAKYSRNAIRHLNRKRIGSFMEHATASLTRIFAGAIQCRSAIIGQMASGQRRQYRGNRIGLSVRWQRGARHGSGIIHRHGGGPYHRSPLGTRACMRRSERRHHRRHRHANLHGIYPRTQASRLGALRYYVLVNKFIGRLRGLTTRRLATNFTFDEQRASRSIITTAGILRR